MEDDQEVKTKDIEGLEDEIFDEGGVEDENKKDEDRDEEGDEISERNKDKNRKRERERERGRESVGTRELDEGGSTEGNDDDDEVFISSS